MASADDPLGLAKQPSGLQKLLADQVSRVNSTILAARKQGYGVTVSIRSTFDGGLVSVEVEEDSDDTFKTPEYPGLSHYPSWMRDPDK